jgi:hypothetical protein
VGISTNPGNGGTRAEVVKHTYFENEFVRCKSEVRRNIFHARMSAVGRSWRSECIWKTVLTNDDVRAIRPSSNSVVAVEFRLGLAESKHFRIAEVALTKNLFVEKQSTCMKETTDLSVCGPRTQYMTFMPACTTRHLFANRFFDIQKQFPNIGRVTICIVFAHIWYTLLLRHHLFV